MKFFCCLVSLFCLLKSVSGLSQQNLHLEKKIFNFSTQPIDVVIPCADIDIECLDRCIKGIRNNIDVNRIIVVSPRRLTKNAEWFDEKNYPFNKYSIAQEIFGNDQQAKFQVTSSSRIGWIYQQFLKLYAPLVIPNISSNVLVVDADTIFLNSVQFLDSLGCGFYNYGSEYHIPYFQHMDRLIPGLKRVNINYSGISHHMLFQREVIEDLFRVIESYHGVDAWKAMSRCIDLQYYTGSSLSEYEIYFNFVFTRTDQVKIRPLLWANISDINEIPKYKKLGYHFISYHYYLRK